MKEIFAGILGVVISIVASWFITLKIDKTINWSWFCVLSPIWIPLVLVIILILT